MSGRRCRNACNQKANRKERQQEREQADDGLANVFRSASTLFHEVCGRPQSNGESHYRLCRSSPAAFFRPARRLGPFRQAARRGRARPRWAVGSNARSRIQHDVQPGRDRQASRPSGYRSPSVMADQTSRASGGLLADVVHASLITPKSRAHTATSPRRPGGPRLRQTPERRCSGRAGRVP